MHLLWRWRRQLLDPGKIWHLGPGLVATFAHLSDAPHLNAQDLDYHEKQHWMGVQKIFSKETVDFLTDRIKNHKEVRNEYATLKVFTIHPIWSKCSPHLLLRSAS